MPLPAGNKLYLSPRGIGSNHEAIKLSACLGNCLRTENFFKLVVLEVKRWAISSYLGNPGTGSKLRKLLYVLTE